MIPPTDKEPYTVEYSAVFSEWCVIFSGLPKLAWADKKQWVALRFCDALNAAYALGRSSGHPADLPERIAEAITDQLQREKHVPADGGEYDKGWNEAMHIAAHAAQNIIAKELAIPQYRKDE